MLVKSAHGNQDISTSREHTVLRWRVLLVLIILQLPSAASARGKGQSASCLNNHQQLVRAWQLYADANSGRLVGNLDGGDVSVLANSNKTWVLGWFDFNGGTLGANTNTLNLTNYSPLAPYLNRQASVFKCPVDSSLSKGRTGTPRPALERATAGFASALLTSRRAATAWPRRPAETVF